MMNCGVQPLSFDLSGCPVFISEWTAPLKTALEGFVLALLEQLIDVVQPGTLSWQWPC